MSDLSAAIWLHADEKKIAAGVPTDSLQKLRKIVWNPEIFLYLSLESRKQLLHD
jgi:hypothetical protein